MVISENEAAVLRAAEAALENALPKKGFTLNVKLNDADIVIDVSGYDDVRDGIAACVKVFRDDGYVANLWSGLVNDNWGDDDDD